MNIKRLIIGYITFCLLVSVYAYIGGCIFNFNIAIKEPGMILAYIMLHLIFQSYIIVPAVFLYFILFRKIEKSIALKIIFFTMVAIFLYQYLRPDDWNLVTGKMRYMKQYIAYSLGALSMVLIDEYIVIPKLTGKSISNEEIKPG